MHKLSRREALSGTGVVALAAAVVPFAAKAGVLLAEEQVLSLAHDLLNNKSGITAGEWIERKRIARSLKAIVKADVAPWEEWEIEVQAESRRHRTGEAWS